MEKNVSKLNICTKAREHNNDSHKYSCVKLSCYQHIFSSLTYLLPSSAHKKRTYIHMLCGVMVRKNCSFKFFFIYFTCTYTQARGFLCDNHIIFCSTALDSKVVRLAINSFLIYSPIIK